MDLHSRNIQIIIKLLNFQILELIVIVFVEAAAFLLIELKE